MSPKPLDLDTTYIDGSTQSLDLDTTSLDAPPAKKPERIPAIQLDSGAIDPRLKLLSHSSRTTLHKCPRKYQLYRLASNTVAMAAEKETHQAVTFAYGSAVGVGVASTLEGKSEDAVLYDTFLAWDTDLLDQGALKHNKSFATTMFAVQKFIALREDGFLEDYELVYIELPEAVGEMVPATELSFQITLPNGFRYRGFVDAVLKHKHTGEIMVLEAKTTSGTAQSAQYKNSGQAIGYSVVLDILFPELSSYKVLYLVYESNSCEYRELPFIKSLLQRALWLQELIIDTHMIELYESFDIYPMHGESCFDFFRDCEYLGMCTMSTKVLTKPLTQKILDKIEKEDEKYDFKIEFSDLVEMQIAKGEL